MTDERRPCRDCDGTGRRGPFMCHICRGFGRLTAGDYQRARDIRADVAENERDEQRQDRGR